MKDLRRVPIFARCSRAELGLIDFLMCETQIPPGRVLVREGLPADQMLLVVSGRACISRGGEALGIAGPGTCVAGRELRARSANTVTMTTVTQMVVRVASAAEFRSLTHALPQVGDRHVLLARGRDYADVRPLSGIYSGPRAEEFGITVEVTRLG